MDPITICPVCGYELDIPSWDGELPSDEICPSCGIQFGYNDATGGDMELRRKVHDTWRSEWVAKGMPWSSVGQAPPKDWDPIQQLRRVAPT